MVGNAAVIYAHNRTVCNAARHNDIEIHDILEWQFEMLVCQIVGVVEVEMKARAAHPICEDIPTLIRTLAGTIALTLIGDSMLGGCDSDVKHRVLVLEQMWLNAL